MEMPFGFFAALFQLLLPKSPDFFVINDDRLSRGLDEWHAHQEELTKHLPAR